MAEMGQGSFTKVGHRNFEGDRNTCGEYMAIGVYKFAKTHQNVYFFSFLGPYLQHMEVCRLGGESELQLLAYIRAIATQDPSCIFDLLCNLWQPWILNPLSKAGIEPTSSWIPCWVLTPLSHNGNSNMYTLKGYFKKFF